MRCPNDSIARLMRLQTTRHPVGADDTGGENETFDVILNDKCPRKRTLHISLTSQNKTTAKHGSSDVSPRDRCEPVRSGRGAVAVVGKTRDEATPALKAQLGARGVRGATVGSEAWLAATPVAAHSARPPRPPRRSRRRPHQPRPRPRLTPPPCLEFPPPRLLLLDKTGMLCKIYKVDI